MTLSFTKPYYPKRLQNARSEATVYSHADGMYGLLLWASRIFMGLLAVILNQFEVHFVTIELNVGYNTENAAKAEVTFQFD